MVLRLSLDAARRKWLFCAFVVFQMYVAFKTLGRLWPATEGLALTMAASWFVAFPVGEFFTESRELYQLPVARRTWWITRWWLTVTVPVALAQTAALLALWSRRSAWPSAEECLLNVTFGALYCGCAMSLRTTAFGRWGDTPVERESPGRTVLFGALMLGLFAGLFAAPLVLAPYLPHSFAEMGVTSVAVMLAMMAFTTVGYRHHPPIEPRPSLRSAKFHASPHSADRTGRATRHGFVDRLTGMKLVLWNECRKQVILFTSLVALGAAYWVVSSRIWLMPALDEFFRMGALYPFSSPRAFITEPITFGFLIVAASFVDGWMATGMRSLRTLPLSSTQLGFLPAAQGLVSASMLWIVLLALHALMRDTLPASLRPDLFIAFAAVATLGRTIRCIAPGPDPAKGMLGLAPVAILSLAFAYFADALRVDLVQAGLLVASPLAMAASFGVMRLAVARSRTMYQARAVAI